MIDPRQDPAPSGGVLHVVATPIGNLGDLGARAGDVLRAADLVLSEDTRRTGRLLAHVGSDAPQRSLHEHNERARVDEVVARVAGGARVALVTDAGTPLVSDPGLAVVRGCAAAGLAVVPIPGPSAPLAALVAAGLPTDRFTFEGFLPRRGRARAERLAELADEPRTAVLFVAPHRAAADLADLAAACGDDRPAVLCRELTKLHEEVRRGSLGSLRDGLGEVRGEVTLVVGGAATPARSEEPAPDDLAAVRARVAAGESRRDAVAAVARTRGLPRRALYAAVLAADAGPDIDDTDDTDDDAGAGDPGTEAP